VPCFVFPVDLADSTTDDRTLAASKVTQASEAARRYASALFDLAQDKGELASVHKDFQAFAKLPGEAKDLATLMASPAFSADEKVSGLSAIMKKAGFSGLLVNFVGVMARNGRSQDILGAQIAFDELYAKQRGVKRAVVRTAKEMSGAERQRIESILAKAVGGEVELSSEVDPSLIGGIQLRIGSQLVDASLAAKLDRMNTAMKGA